MPRYQHDCSKCVSLGEYERADLYFCEQDAARPTVVARYSDVRSDYTSGLALVSLNKYLMNKYLTRAVTLATERGLLK